MDKHHSYAADAGAEKPVTSVRPEKQKPPVKPLAKNQFAPTNTEDSNKPEGGDTKQARDYRQQLIQSRIAAVENPANKNPFHFTHPLDQQAATYAKAERIIKNPRFAALPQDKKDRILSNYYDKYVVPVYQNAKIEPPHKDAWVSQVGKGFFKTSDFYEYSEATNKDAFTDLQAGIVHAQTSAVQTAGHIGHSIIMAGVIADRKILGLANFFPGSALHSWATEQADHEAKLAEPALKFSQDVIDRPTFWLDTHPSKSYTEKAGSFVGEQIVQLPMYTTIEAPLGALGKAVSSAGSVGKAANFTRRLATSKTGQFVGRRLAEASSAYIGDIFSETPQGDRATDMAIFMGLGVGGEVLKTLAKPITRAAMKKVAATNIAVGGKVFHETIADQAEFELAHNIVGTDAAGNPILHEEGKFSEQMHAAQQADPVKHAAVTAEKISQNAMARQLYDKPLNQLSKLQRRKVRTNLAQLGSEAAVEIPIHVPEVAQHEVTEKLSEDVQSNPELGVTFSYLEEKYQAKIVDSVVKEEQDSIAVERGIKSTQGATRNVGKNEKILADANANLAEGRPIKLRSPEELAALNPKKPALTREQGHFGDFNDTGNMRYNSGDQGYNVKFQSPVDKALYRLTSNTEKARAARPEVIKRLDKYFGGTKSQSELVQMGHRVKEQLDAEVKSRRSVYDSDPKTHSEIAFPEMHKYSEPAKPARAQVETGTKSEKVDLPRSYVSFKANNLAHFTNPFKTKAAKSNKSLENFLTDLSDDDFVKEISDQMGNQIHFEKPYDMLLWGLHHSSDLPRPISKRIKEVLHDQDPGATYESMKDEAKRLSYHIDLLAMSGRLDTEGNVFRSTITSSFTGRTKWQLQLEKEVALGEIENFKNTMAPYKKNFSDQYDAGLKELAKIQMLRKRSKTDADFFAAHDKIKKVLADAEGKK